MDEREEFHSCYDEKPDPSPALVVWVFASAALTALALGFALASRVF